MNLDKNMSESKEIYYWTVRNAVLEDASAIDRIQKAAWLDTYTSEIITAKMLLKRLENNKDLNAQIISMQDFIKTSVV